MSVIGPFWYWQVLLLQFLTIISWKLNNNKCIITQLEDYLFNETIVDIYFKYIGNNKKYVKYIVPWNQRYFLYLLFIVHIYLQFLKYFVL